MNNVKRLEKLLAMTEEIPNLLWMPICQRQSLRI